MDLEYNSSSLFDYRSDLISTNCLSIQYKYIIILSCWKQVLETYDTKSKTSTYVIGLIHKDVQRVTCNIHKLYHN